MDLTNASDAVQHEILQKMEKYGLEGHAYDLRNRLQIAKLLKLNQKFHNVPLVYGRVHCWNPYF